jgi:hypothetical protein
MYDTTIHQRTLARQLRISDFIADPLLFGEPHRRAMLNQAAAIGTFGFPPLNVTTSTLRGKNIYQLADLPALLVTRHLTSNIRRITGVKQDDRKFIVECVRTLLETGTSFRVYKFDIKAYYESVLVEDILDRLKLDIAFSGQSSQALESLFQRLQNAGIYGLPRGMALSATLSEYLLRGFDHAVSNMPGVWYYSRFVDDMIVIGSSDLHPIIFTQSVANILPNGLSFNEKSQGLNFVGLQKAIPLATEGTFPFLGYQFDVSRAFRRPSGRTIFRTVTVDMAPSKVRRLKTRIVRAALQYKKDGIFFDLRDRIRLLTSNFTFVDRKTGERRISGIYFNYPLIDISSANCFDALDRFLRNLITSPHPKNSARPALTPQRRRELVRLTFRSGFEQKRFFHFNTDRLVHLRSCWHHA